MIHQWVRRTARQTIRRTVWCAAVVATTVAATLPVIAVPAAAGTVPDGSTGAPMSQSAAIEQAQQSGEPVVVPSKTTPYEQTEALPDGNLQTTYNAEPVRAQRDGAWVPINLDLVPNPDSTYSPAASVTPVRLSAGGDGPLAVLTSDGHSLAFSWPGTLPQPVVSGPVATYRNVLPGVDLQAAATSDGGFSEVLVVTSPAAASNPALTTLTFPTSGSDLTVSADPVGNLTAADETGRSVFHAAAPLMWDSGAAAQPDSAMPRAPGTTTAAAQPADVGSALPTSPPDGATVEAVGVDVTATSITLTPDPDLLTGTNTQYPVYIDPGWHPVTKNSTGWTWAQQANPNTSWWKDSSNGNPAVGYQGWDASYQGKNNSFWQFNISDLADAHIHYAELKTTETDSGPFSCTASYNIVATSVGHISTATTWNNQPSVADQQDTVAVAGASRDAGCAQRSAAFNVTSAAASDGDGVLTIRLSAANETDRNYYKRFSGTATTLYITYNFHPNAPTNLAMSPAPINPSGLKCGGGPYGWIDASGSTFALSAYISDVDSTYQSIRADFHIWDKGASGTATAINIMTFDDAAGQTVFHTGNRTDTKTFSTSLLPNGHLIGFNAITDDGYWQSSAAPQPCYFWVDKSKPAPAPTVSTGASPIQTRQPITFTVSGSDTTPAGGTASGINHFTYSTSSAAALAHDGGTHQSATHGAGSTYTANITFTPTVWGVNYLYVAAVDNAGLQSDTTTYKYYAADNPTCPDPNQSPPCIAPGDVTGDHIPDLLGADTGGDLLIFNTTTTQPASPRVAATALDSPDGTGWNGVLIAHRSAASASTSGTGVDDLWALNSEFDSLVLYHNTQSATGTIYDTGHSSPVYRPTCQYTCGTDYNATDWSNVSQMVAPGDIDGDGHADLLTVENGELWYFHGDTTTGQFDWSELVGYSGWQPWHVIAPGDVTGDGTPDLWAAFTGTGTASLRLYTLTYSATTHIVTVAYTASNTAATPGWAPSSRRIITSAGDTDGDGKPDLLTVDTNTPSRLLHEEFTNVTGTTLNLTTSNVVDDTFNWSTIDDLK